MTTAVIEIYSKMKYTMDNLTVFKFEQFPRNAYSVKIGSCFFYQAVFN